MADEFQVEAVQGQTPEQLAAKGYDPAKTVEVTFERMFCPLHGELFRERWPTGGLLFQLEGIRLLLERKEFADAVAELGGDDFKQGCEAALDREPVCCRTCRIRGPNALIQLYLFAGANHPNEDPLFKVRTCAVCRRSREGGPMRFRVGDTTQRVPHVCVRCVVTKLRLT